MTEETPSENFLNNKQYDFVKFLTVVVFPAIGTLYFALSSVWGLPDAQQVLGTLLAIEAFIGAVLGISTKAYNASDAKYTGEINVTKAPDKTVYSLDLNHAVEDLDKKDEALFKVNTSK